MTDFNHDYAVFDEFGLVKLLCMNCGTVIAERQFTNVKSILDPNKTMLAAIGPIKNSSFRDVPVELSDGSYANMKLCKGCETQPLDQAKIVNQILRAHESEVKHSGTENDVSGKKHFEKWKTLTIIGNLGRPKKGVI